MSACRLKYLLASVLLLLPFLCSGQVNVFTKKARIADFAAKTTKIVMSGDQAYDLVLRSEIASRWRISPYEFCSEEEYVAQAGSRNHYFLRTTEDKTGLLEMVLSKGGGKGGASNLDSRMDVVSVPVDIRYMPVIIDIIQKYVEDATVSETTALFGLKSYNGSLRKVRRRNIHFADGNDEYFTDSLLTHAVPCLVAFSISSEKPSKKSTSALFVVSADTHKLYYYKRRRFDSEALRGFSGKEKDDINKDHEGR